MFHFYSFLCKIVCVCVCVHKGQRGLRIPGARIEVISPQPWVLELNSGPLEAQEELSTTKSPLQSKTLI